MHTTLAEVNVGFELEDNLYVRLLPLTKLIEGSDDWKGMPVDFMDSLDSKSIDSPPLSENAWKDIHVISFAYRYSPSLSGEDDERRATEIAIKTERHHPTGESLFLTLANLGNNAAFANAEYLCLSSEVLEDTRHPTFVSYMVSLQLPIFYEESDPFVWLRRTT